MQINWLGQGGIKITIKDPKGEKLTVIIDPPDPSSGIKVRGGVDADLVLFSGAKPDKLSVAENAKVIETPGEYEIKGVGFLGRQVGDTIIWRLSIEGLKVGHLGKLDKTMTESDRAFMTGLDVLIVPVGGKEMLNAVSAAELTQSLEPKIIIPTYFKIPNLVPALESVDRFCKESACPMERMEKLTLHKRDIPEEGMKMVILEP